MHIEENLLRISLQTCRLGKTLQQFSRKETFTAKEDGNVFKKAHEIIRMIFHLKFVYIAANI